MQSIKTDPKIPFIVATALDYDMDYEDVKRIYDLWNKDNLFYEKLEEVIEHRKNNNQ